MSMQESSQETDTADTGRHKSRGEVDETLREALKVDAREGRRNPVKLDRTITGSGDAAADLVIDERRADSRVTEAPRRAASPSSAETLASEAPLGYFRAVHYRWTCLRLITGILAEGGYNLLCMLFFLLGRRSVHRRRFSELLATQKMEATNEKRPRTAGRRAVLTSLLLAAALLLLGPVGCQSVNREWGRFAWSVTAMTDSSGDWDRLVSDVQTLLQGEDGSLVETFQMIGF